VRGADALIRALEREGVDVVFGIPGGAALPIYDALHDSPIRHVLMRHEAGAGHAAQGYARATGRVGVAIATSGPGATNLVTPITDAMADSTPVVFVTGQVRTDLRGTDAFQEADVLAITAPIVKHGISVESADDIGPAIQEAFHIARTGRPGPVVVDVPSDLAKAPARDRTVDPAAELPGYRPHTVPNGRQVRRAAEALCVAKRPVLYVGGGAVQAEATAEVAALAEAADLPVTTTLMGLGAFPGTDPRWIGMLGMHGCRAANWAMDEADLIVAVGARFDDRVTGDVAQFARGATIVHIDVDPAEIDKIVAARIPVVADAKLALAAIAAAFAPLRDATQSRAAWWQRIDGWRAAETDGPAAGGADHLIDPHAVLDALQAATGGEAFVTTDVGQHQMWAANRLRFDRPRRWITSGGLGTMGYGLPAALGAQAAHPDATVVCVTGDGSLPMNVQELATAAAEGLPVKIVLLHNASLGMVRQQQDMLWEGRRVASDLGADVDWAMLAAAFGVAGRTVDAPGDVADALAATLAEEGPALLDVRIAPEADALPMFFPGTPAREMVG
jgi:acetolactate synthase I/II/III large subunit